MVNYATILLMSRPLNACQDMSSSRDEWCYIRQLAVLPGCVCKRSFTTSWNWPVRQQILFDPTAGATLLWSSPPGHFDFLLCYLWNDPGGRKRTGKYRKVTQKSSIWRNSMICLHMSPIISGFNNSHWTWGHTRQHGKAMYSCYI